MNPAYLMLNYAIELLPY